MTVPKIDLRLGTFNSEYKRNLMAVNINMCRVKDDKIYMPSEISHLIAKIMFDTSIYADISRLFKILSPRDINMVQVIILENISNEELIRQKLLYSKNYFDESMKKNNYSKIKFITSSSWIYSGIDEFLTLPIKSLSIQGSKLIAPKGYGDTSGCLLKLSPRVLLSTPTDMFWDDVPCPKQIHLTSESDYIFSKGFYSCPDDDPANILAIDCEMVNTGNAEDLTLARISIVRCTGGCDLRTPKGIKEWFGKGAPYEIVYDKLVKPPGTIVDYLTKYSGITCKSLEGITLNIDDVHEYLRTVITPCTVIVGHSVQMDLKALRLYHPYIIDTSTIYNMASDLNRKPGLVSLSKDILKQEIRKGKNGRGHDSVEDAYTALKLTMKKLLKHINFGNAARISHFSKTTNTMAGEWKDVAVDTLKIPEVKVDKVEYCHLNFGVENEKTSKSEDSQRNIDKFILLTEQPAVVKIPELMQACNKSMEVIANMSGLMGRSQSGNNGTNVHLESSDEKVVVKTIDRCRKNDLVISVLSDFCVITPNSDKYERLTTMTSLRNNIEKIVSHLPDQSAVLVILPGQNQCQGTGKLYWKIK